MDVVLTALGPAGPRVTLGQPGRERRAAAALATAVLIGGTSLVPTEPARAGVANLALTLVSSGDVGCPRGSVHSFHGGGGTQVLNFKFSRLTASPTKSQPVVQVSCVMTVAVSGVDGRQVAVEHSEARGSFVLAPRSSGSVRVALSFTAPPQTIGEGSWAVSNAADTSDDGPVLAAVDTAKKVWSECGEPTEIRFVIAAGAAAEEFTRPTLLNLTTAEVSAGLGVEQRACPRRREAAG